MSSIKISNYSSGKTIAVDASCIPISTIAENFPDDSVDVIRALILFHKKEEVQCVLMNGKIGMYRIENK